LADEKWARIAAEYGGTCVWYQNGVGTGIDELPITPGLRDALQGWGNWYDDCEDFMPKHLRDPALRFNDVLHREVGIALAKAVKEQLPDWTIMFGWPRERIEIEIEGRR
jgi:hypothetical protein